MIDTCFPLLLLCSLQGFQGFGFGDGGFQMSFGIGAFPFGIFATAFNINDGRPPPGTSSPRVLSQTAVHKLPRNFKQILC